jgi:hypothetical protein
MDIDLGRGKSLLRVLLEKRVSTGHSIARRQLDSALIKMVERSNAFQSTTTLRPFSQLCLSLDDLKSSQSEVLDFIENSFQRFMQMPYSYFDEVASLSPNDKIATLSPILTTLFRQWEYNEKRNEKSEYFNVVTDWLCDFIVRLVIIGEDDRAICKLTQQPRKGNRRREFAKTLEVDICRWTGIHGPSLTRPWSEISNLPISTILRWVEVEEMETRSEFLMSLVEKNVFEHGSYCVVVLFRRFVAMQLTFEEVLQKDIDRCSSFLLQVMLLQKRLDERAFEDDSKKAIVETFNSIFTQLTTLTPTIFKFIDRIFPFV